MKMFFIIRNQTGLVNTKSLRILTVVAIIFFLIIGFLIYTYFSSMNDLNSFMNKRYGQLSPDKKYWVKNDDGLCYVVCASQDIKINGEPHRMVAVCGELPEERRYHAASGYVDLYVMKRSRTGFTPVAELEGVESGSWGTPGSVSVVRLGKEFYGFKEESGWSGMGVTNGYTTIYVPTPKSFHKALRFSDYADDLGVYTGDEEEGEARTKLERTIEFIPGKGSNIFLARIKSGGYVKGKPISTVHSLPYNLKRHEYMVPKDFTADMGF
jgi:hypothetical protein